MIKIYEFFSDYYISKEWYHKNNEYFPNEYVITGIEDVFDSSHRWQSIYLWYSVESKEWVFQFSDAETEEQIREKIVQSHMKHTLKEVDFFYDLNSDFFTKIMIKLCFLKETKKGRNLLQKIFRDRPYLVNKF